MSKPNSRGKFPTFGESTHESPKVVSLLEFSNTDFCHILKILSDAVQEFTTYVSLTCEKAIQRVLMFRRLFGKGVEFLQ